MCAVVRSLVILDEPTNDVDPVRRRLLWDQIRALADDGAAVLLVTHNVREAERAVDRLVILDRGRVIARGAPDDLIAARPHPVVLELTAPPGTVLSPPPGLAVERSEGARTVVGVPAEQSTEAIRLGPPGCVRTASWSATASSRSRWRTSTSTSPPTLSGLMNPATVPIPRQPDTPTMPDHEGEEARMTAAITTAPTTPAGLWRQTGLLIQWQLRRSLPVMPLLMVIQAFLSVSTIPRVPGSSPATRGRRRVFIWRPVRPPSPWWSSAWP